MLQGLLVPVAHRLLHAGPCAGRTLGGDCLRGGEEPTRALDRQDEFAHRGAALEHPVCLRGLFQREDLGHAHFDGA